MKTTQANMPALKECEVISHHVGLRPGRNNVRLETEKRWIGAKEIPIVHNYGHGGSGVTLFWGCAMDAAELVKKSLQEKNLSKL
ncbi:hypothetical protein OESDEN_25448 [Oesophagostomum dentatum]|uniref:FAD dependent oxidoreductase domain-containing protein n=1 Tax=Oesophagostomum dentatum TaxID=61180 RepID=A0A0B1RTH1_OESDE|nr:hypothetical protein OESDEN_25448 [Oesophagostomum dentatum]